MALAIAARNVFRLFAALLAARAMVREFEPDVIFATGGYVSAPVMWAGAREKIPSVLYLPDLEPGWAIRISARAATRIAITFAEAARFFPRGKAVVTGYPVRAGFFETDRARARKFFQLDMGKPVITILGGSRGAHAINQAVAHNLATLAPLAQLIWITGLDDEMAMKEKAKEFEHVRVFGYLDAEMPHALAAADVVIARAGASVLGELPAVGVPAILAPYPHAGRHQELNAEFLVARGAAVRVDNAALEKEIAPTAKRVLANAPAMREKMRALAQPDAAKRIAGLLESVSVRGCE